MRRVYVYLADFRMIPLGDIDLQQEICLANNTGVVSRRGRSDCRVYSAKLRDKDVTVATYQGDGAVEKWRQDLTKHSSLRFCSLSQNWYLYLLKIRQFRAAEHYLHSISQLTPLPLKSQEPSLCTLWLRRSTGRLSVDLMQPDKPTSLHKYLTAAISEVQGLLLTNPHIMEAAVTDSLTLEDYHKLCYLYLHHSSSCFISAGVATPSHHHVEIASLPWASVANSDWFLSRGEGPESGAVLENGWRRFYTPDVVDNTLSLQYQLLGDVVNRHWPSQANYIFNCHRITSNFNDYVAIAVAVIDPIVLP
ncbi:hypothetical protein DFH06DRAFT_1373049 [Mycena polygramma]|nr:hypothetical protein DFH06DRAFT_1373049 [Mycena polygramma]